MTWLQLLRPAAVCSFLLLSATALLPAARAAGVDPPIRFHVDPDAAPGGDGTTWATAFDSLDAALDATPFPPYTGARVEIWMTAGTYTPTVRADPADPLSVRFKVPNKVSLYGGFAGTEVSLAERTGKAGDTILTADVNGDDGPDFTNRSDNARVLVINTHLLIQPLVLDTLVFEGVAASPSASNEAAAGVRITASSSVDVLHCRFRESEPGTNGMLVDLTSRNTVFTDCAVEDNLVQGVGIAVQANTFDTTSSDVTGCTFQRNTSAAISGNPCLLRIISIQTVALDDVTFTDNTMLSFSSNFVRIVLAGDLTMNACTASGNEVAGTAFDVTGASASNTLVTNCHVTNNTLDGSGFHLDGSDVITVDQCSVTNNIMPSRFAFHIDSDVEAMVTNCTADDNLGMAYKGGGKNHTVENCSFQRNTATLVSTIVSSAPGSSTDSVTFRNCIIADNDISSIGEASTMWAETATTNIENCEFLRNTADYGGALSVGGSGGSDVIVDGCTMRDNIARMDSGAIYLFYSSDTTGTLTVRNTVIENNMSLVANGGFGQYESEGPFEPASQNASNSFIGCSFIGNHAVSGAGAVNMVNGTLTDCLFFDNSTDIGVGAVHVATSSTRAVHIDRCRFLQNSGASSGALRIASLPIVTRTIWNSVFTGNVATVGTGALHSTSSQLDVSNCTFLANESSTNRSAVEFSEYYETPSSVAVLRNSILRQNIAGGMNTEATQLGFVVPPTTISVHHSCIEGLSVFAGPTNIDLDPLFIDPLGTDGLLGTIDDNLMPGPDSPVINAGEFYTGYAADAIDAIGQQRNLLCRTDMGAIEAETSNQPILDQNENGIDDYCELAFGFANDCNLNAVPDTIEIDQGVALDCNGNNVPDACEVFADPFNDCNNNGIPDECDLLDPNDGDCNLNGIPDSCDTSGTQVYTTGVIAPFNPGAAITIPAIPRASLPTGDVEIEFQTIAGLANPLAAYFVYLNGTNIGSVFGGTEHDCPETPDVDSLSIPMQLFIDLTASGSIELFVNPNLSVNNPCPDNTMLAVVIVHDRVPLLNDDNGNLVFDECEEPLPCPTDCQPMGGNGAVNIDDIIAVINTFGTTDLTCDVAPVGGNGIINIDDLVVVINSFGDCQ
jgi:hypothetical protein